MWVSSLEINNIKSFKVSGNIRLAACRRERSRDLGSRYASMQVIDGTRKGERMEGDRRQNRVVMMRPVGCEHAVILELGPEEGMEALEIESQTDQTPLAGSRQFPAQGKLAKTQHLLDDADHRFDGAFA